MSIFWKAFTCPAAPSDPGVIFSSQSQYYLYGEYCRSAVLLERVGYPPGWASSCWTSVFMSWECSGARHAVLPSAACRERLVPSSGLSHLLRCVPSFWDGMCYFSKVLVAFHWWGWDPSPRLVFRWINFKSDNNAFPIKSCSVPWRWFEHTFVGNCGLP